MTIAELFSRLRQENIKVSADSGQLVIRGPAGHLTAELRAELAAQKKAILNFLSDRASSAMREEPVLQRVSREQRLPLSFSQQRLWFLDQYEPNSCLYNIPSALRLRGPLDIKALEQSLNEIVRRHESLRTTFSMVDGEPVQVISPFAGLSLPVVNLKVYSQGEREAHARRLAREEARQPFNLSCGPLFRRKLLRLDEEDHVLLLTMHHIVSDGWSMALFYRELSVLYRVFLDGQPSPLAELPVQYADYALWQREWLKGRVLDNQLSYWRKQLQDVATLQLPTDRPRPAMQSYHGARQSLVLSRDLSERLNALSGNSGATLFMTMLAVFQTLLHRYTMQDDIAVGSPIAGRNRPEVEGLIGFFLNTLVLRTDLSGNPTFRELLGRVRESCLEAYAHQDVPFEKLLEEIRPARDRSRSPIFQVFFNMVNVGTRRLPFPRLKIERLSTADIGSKFDVTIYIREQNHRIHLGLVYKPALFDQPRMEELLRQYRELLWQIVEHPEESIASYSLVTPAAQELLPNPTAPLSSHWAGSVQERLSYQARRRPDDPAVRDPYGSWSYGELNARANQLAHYLVGNGIQREDIVVIYAHRSASLVWALMGTLKAGAAFLILDPAYPVARLMAYVGAAKPRGFIQLEAAGAVPSELEALIETNLRCRITLPRLLRVEPKDLLQRYSQEDPEIATGPDDLACVCFTSGSTGEPKGIMGRHGPLSHFLPWQAERFSLSPSDRFSVLSGLSHDPLQREIFTAVWVGATICIPDPAILGGPGKLAEWMAERGITFAHLTPALGRLLTETANPSCHLSSLRYAFFVGDKLTWADVDCLQGLAPSVTCVNYYGSTETQRAVSYYEIAPELNKAVGETVVPVGRGMPNVQLLVLTRETKLAGIGELGEIYIRSPHLARGYLGDTALTQARFITNPFTREAQDRLYRTGDFGRYLPDGNVEILGRRDGQVKIRGFRIELGEIESVLSRNPAVREAVVLAREDETKEDGAAQNPKSQTSTQPSGSIQNPKSKIQNPKSDKRLVAYVVLRKDTACSSHSMRSHLRQELPEYMVPSAFLFLDSLPLTPNGKIDGNALPGPDRSRPDFEHTYVAPRNPTEEMLAEIWVRLLGVERIGIGDNFFDVGGHSLLAVRLFAEIEKVFKKRPPLSSVFQEPTIAHLAALISQDGLKTKPSCVVAIQPHGSRPALFCVHTFFGDILCYINLARHLGPDQPFYAIEAPGLNGSEEPFDNIKSMAAHYIEQIRAVQPQGPYAVGGLCSAGTVAFEIAQQLHTQGERVALVALLDTQLHHRRDGKATSRWSFLRDLLVDAPAWLKGSLELNRAQWIDLLKLKIRMARARKTPSSGSQITAQNRGASLIQEMADFFYFSEQHYRIARAQSRALRNYKPQVYPGRLTLFKARMQPLFSSHNPDKGWKAVAGGGLEIRVVPGNQLAMLKEPHVQILAEQLRSCLDRALTEASASAQVPT